MWDDPLIWVRTLHFVATVSVAGVVFFLAFVGEPSLRIADSAGSMAAAVRSRLAPIRWLGLGLVVITGIAWFLLQAMRMSERPLTEVWSQGVIWTLLFGTDFGFVWMVRFGAVVLLAAAISPRMVETRGKFWIEVICAGVLIGGLAFAGHAAAGEGLEGSTHLAADILHLLAAAAWLGALVPLAMLLGAAGKWRDDTSIEVARAATLRFSTLGIVSVGTLAVTGVVNTWVLVGSVRALIETEYGRLLLLKLVLFTLMLAIAAVNRLRLTPQLVGKPSSASAPQDALRQLRRNSLIEASLGVTILGLVAALGTLSPAE